MKFVIASDLHGSAYWCRKLMEVVEQEQPVFQEYTQPGEDT